MQLFIETKEFLPIKTIFAWVNHSTDKKYFKYFPLKSYFTKK